MVKGSKVQRRRSSTFLLSTVKPNELESQQVYPPWTFYSDEEPDEPISPYYHCEECGEVLGIYERVPYCNKCEAKYDRT